MKLISGAFPPVLLHRDPSKVYRFLESKEIMYVRSVLLSIDPLTESSKWIHFPSITRSQRLDLIDFLVLLGYVYDEQEDIWIHENARHES